MSVTFVVVPEWQGSGSSRAMRLIDGAESIRGDLPSAATHLVEVPMEAGEEQETGIHRFSSLTEIRSRIERVLVSVASADPQTTTITIGGDCAVELAATSSALARWRESGQPGENSRGDENGQGTVAVVWFDAHADLNTPRSSPSGSFSGMVLRALLGESAAGLRAEGPGVVSAGELVLAGVRSMDEAESDFLASNGIPLVSVEQLATPDALVAAVDATGASAVYLHVDLDVIDPAEFEGVGFPEPFGVTTEQLTTAIRALTARFTVAGAGITGFSPASPEDAGHDLPAILRVLGALTR
ncbi:arginase family protein [Compostimonas suwonensis]|uniref:Arginase n=1 Tax=Compostimonas suwonensis TaxID=1048394 RepID=A0A2M9BUJ5_9MICO|nr:arginase family protein [Compostimonas suwonensis]PJJ61616.1 arginase [Compostimonas suwonensis]